ncbi:MAG TPA: 4a-hydroxytetrahydrobiopterin dehydratase [Elusimicrobiota bacterium]|nr:4a-hydroxytetrahydrobiopterin dehydratase [Elusimicrobiota bacterium]
MNPLAEIKCVPCREGAEPVTLAEIDEFLPFIPDWQIIERAGIPRLERAFEFKDFAEAMAFTDRIAALAEQEGHHPVLITEWGRVTVAWWTHKIKGLHRNDFIMAAKTDERLKTPAA